MGPGARAVIAGAADEARALGHAYVGTEHLLLGTLAHRPIPGLTLEQARADVEREVGRGDGSEGELPFTARAKKALDLAVREAHPALFEPEHIVLGILREGQGVGAQLLRAAQPAADTLRAALHEALATVPAEGPFQVVELRGDAAGWEAQLNDAATDGYELVSIVERRAVLCRTA
jgi:ATP-dependent Clp protease ATP-binding subunit ClpC